MIYAFCEKRDLSNNRVEIVRLNATTTQKELDEYRNNFKKVGCFNRFEFFVNMIKYDGRLLLDYLKTTIAETPIIDFGVCEVANKLVFDFAAAFGSFIDYIEKRLLPKQTQDVQDEYEELRKKFFQNDIYKFWYYMRHYVIHYDILITNAETKKENNKYVVNFFADKEYLLKYKEWKHAKEFIKSMEQKIKVDELVQPLIELANELYIELLYLFRNVLIETNSYIKNFLHTHIGENCNKNNIYIIAYKSETEYRNNSGGILQTLNLPRMAELMHKLKFYHKIP